MSKKLEELPEREKQLLKQVCDHFANEDKSTRERQIRVWKKLKFYWDGIQRIWWSETAHDWRTYDVNSLANENYSDSAFYDKPVNVFRAYLESIIAALSVTVPPIKCTPDDADNALDISTARAGDKIAKLVYKHNDVILLWLHALYIYCTEGLIAAYTYSKSDKSYGTYEENEYQEAEEEAYICPVCNNQLADELFTNNLRDKFDPNDSDVPLDDVIVNEEFTICPECASVLDPSLQKSKLVVTRLVGVTEKPKSRQCIEVYGGLFVKIPNYAMKQSDIPYLCFTTDEHYANVFEEYPFLKSNFYKNGTFTRFSGGAFDPYEKWGRISTQYLGETPDNLLAKRRFWLRHSAFNVLAEDDDIEFLKKTYPDGVHVVLIDDTVATACNESLDDHWSLTRNPVADYLHHDPLGMLLTSVQDITNDMISLVLQTIEHGIPQTFADPDVLNFEEYGQVESTPGLVFPAKPRTGKSIGDAFYEVKTASLSGEVQPFMEKVQEAGQLVSGALPSLFGGAAPNSSKTAAQYAMSRAQALQRLQTPWKMLTIWWKDIFGKVIPSYINDVIEDEKFVEKDKDGNYINVFIRKAELQGKIGSIELEANEQLPITWAQRKDVIMQLLQSNNPEVLAALASPENIPLLAEAIGMDDFAIPGEEDRQKQFEEIRLLLDSEPFTDPMTGQEAPSVDIDPLIDNNAIHADLCKNFLISEAGRLARIENPQGYKNVLLHLQRHVQIEQVMAMQNAAPQPQPNSKPVPNAAPTGMNNGRNAVN